MSQRNLAQLEGSLVMPNWVSANLNLMFFVFSIFFPFPPDPILPSSICLFRLRIKPKISRVSGKHSTTPAFVFSSLKRDVQIVQLQKASNLDLPLNKGVLQIHSTRSMKKPQAAPSLAPEEIPLHELEDGAPVAPLFPYITFTSFC